MKEIEFGLHWLIAALCVYLLALGLWFTIVAAGTSITVFIAMIAAKLGYITLNIRIN